MLIQMSWWNKFGGFFTAEEKAALNHAITGETICPMGVIVNEATLDPELVAKVLELKEEREVSI